MPFDGRKTMAAMRQHALSYPGAWEDFPWGETVVKVQKKVFVFLGCEPGDDGVTSFSVKLPVSGEAARDLPFAEPTGYGLGKGGWVTVHLSEKAKVPMEMLLGWIDESYRAIAPKTLVKELDAAAGPPGKPVTDPARKPAAKPAARPRKRS